MSEHIHATIVVTKNVAVNLRELSRRLDKGFLDGMFKTGLVPIGSAIGTTPTHYISTGKVPPVYVNTLSDPVLLFTRAKKAWEDDGDVFPFTQNQVTNALGNCTITDGTYLDPVLGLIDEGPHALIARLGLEIARVAL